MNILVAHTGSLAECFVASAINRGFKRLYDTCDITWAVQNDVKGLFSYSKNVYQVLSVDEFWESYHYDPYDIFVNLGQDGNKFIGVFAKEKRGFVFDEKNARYADCLFGDVYLKMNLFQIYFRLANMSWRGEGYDVSYYPKFKSKKNRVGLSIVNANLRNFVHEKLDLEMSRLWVVPYKKNIFKRMDEINRCDTIVTDDLLTLHIAVSLKKFVHFLKVVPLAFEIEMFGKGREYDIPSSYLR